MVQVLPNINHIKSELCRRKLFFFFCEFWEVTETDELHLNWHIEYLCDRIQAILEGVIKGTLVNDDLVVNVCPGSTKSNILVACQAWLWTRKPDTVMLSNTISDTNANKFSLKFKDIISSEKYRSYFPEIVLRKDSTAIHKTQNTIGGARRQYTTKSKITGDHGHVRFDDDPMAFQDARSDAESKRCIDGYKAYKTRAKKNSYVPYILVSQRLSSIDTSSYVFETKPDILKIVLPAWDNGKIFPPELKKHYVDGLMNPRHVTQKVLADEKMSLGDLQYLAEFGQDCETSEGYMYEIQKVKEMLPKGISIAVCDPADDGECYTATVFADVHSNKVWVKDILYSQENSDITINKNVEKAKQHKPYAFYIERDGLGNIYGKQVKTKYPLVQPFNAKGNKDDRIFSKANVISKHFVFLEQSPNIEYENAVNAMTSYKKVGSNKMKDIQDAMTALADIVIKNNLINIYANN